MVVGVALGRGAMVVLLADVELTTHYGLDPSFARGIHELHGAVDVAMVGHGDGLLAYRGDAPDEAVDAAGTIQQRIIRMEMKMDEIGHRCLILHYMGQRALDGLCGSV